MPKRANYPSWFNQFDKPHFYQAKPLETLSEHREIKRTRLYDGENIEFEAGKFYKLKMEYDDPYDDSPVPYLTEYEIENRENLRFEKELKKYNKDKAKHETNLKEWSIWKAKWDAEQAEEDKARELKQLEKLKKKYESKKTDS